MNSKASVNYFSIYAMPPRIGANTEARVSYDYSYAWEPTSTRSFRAAR